VRAGLGAPAARWRHSPCALNERPAVGVVDITQAEVAEFFRVHPADKVVDALRQARVRVVEHVVGFLAAGGRCCSLCGCANGADGFVDQSGPSGQAGANGVIVVTPVAERFCEHFV
jgi:hypothetical protein